MKVCLVSIIPSHYRMLIYRLLEKELGCSFIFGKERTSIKSLDLTAFKNCIQVQNVYLLRPIYYQKNTLNLLKNYDVIINDLGFFSLTSWMILFYSKISRKKVITWGHAWYGRENYLKKIIKKIYFSMADASLLYGDYAKNLMINNGFNVEKLFVIHNSLNYDSQIAIRNKKPISSIYHVHFDNKIPVLVFIGRLTAVKKLDLLISAVHYLKTRNKLYNIVFVGDGSEKQRLVGLAESLGLINQTWFFGESYDENQNGELLYNADLCVAPGNIGLTAMHAMMFGCPCISHSDFTWQMPEFEAIKENITGTFFKRDDYLSLANAIDRWFSDINYNRELIRQNCFNEIDDKWNPNIQINTIKKVINKIYFNEDTSSKHSSK